MYLNLGLTIYKLKMSAIEVKSNIDFIIPIIDIDARKAI